MKQRLLQQLREAVRVVGRSPFGDKENAGHPERSAVRGRSLWGRCAVEGARGVTSNRDASPSGLHGVLQLRYTPFRMTAYSISNCIVSAENDVSPAWVGPLIKVSDPFRSRNPHKPLGRWSANGKAATALPNSPQRIPNN